MKMRETSRGQDKKPNDNNDLSQCADALSYMALAGWDTQQSMDALPGVLNLAAASGMDLANASDAVTKKYWSVTWKQVA